jgi:hypothetical protein
MALKFNLTQAKRNELKRLLTPVLAESADRIADACNGASSWGAYRAHHHPDVARVSVYNSASDARTNRLLRSLDAGRVL